MTTHELKIDPKFIDPIWFGEKKCEVRVFDRDYKVGDTLILRGWDENSYTGFQVSVVVTHIIPPGTYGLPKNIGVMSIVPVTFVGANACQTTP